MGVFGRSFGERASGRGLRLWVRGLWVRGLLAVSEMTKKDAGGR